MFVVGALSFLLLMSVPPSLSWDWEMPSAKFLEAMASKFQTRGLRMALPDNESRTWSILAMVKQLGVTLKLYDNQINEFVFQIHFSKYGITVCGIGENRVDRLKKDFEQNPTILHVTLPSTYNTKYFNDIINFLSQTLIKRNNSDNDIWLIGIYIPQGEKDTSVMYIYVALL